jgi:hypothetical protein
MIRKSGCRLSEKTMLKQEAKTKRRFNLNHFALEPSLADMPTAQVGLITLMFADRLRFHEILADTPLAKVTPRI